MDFLGEVSKKIQNYLENTHKVVLIVTGFFSLVLIGGIDYLTSPEISLSIFYLLPVSLMSWFFSREAGFVAAIFSVIAELITQPDIPLLESSLLIHYWNYLGVLLFLLAIAYLVFKLRVSLDKEEELIRTDRITGVANKRFFFELAILELKKVNRYRHPITIACIDIDDFKTINETCGDSAGDKLLRTVAQTIKGTIRETDIIARIGGDEFAILLPGSGFEPSHIVITRVQKQLLAAMKEQEWTVTFSIGIVTFMNPPKSVDEMIQQADHLVYLVKNDGKNQLKHKISA